MALQRQRVLQRTLNVRKPFPEKARWVGVALTFSRNVLKVLNHQVNGQRRNHEGNDCHASCANPRFLPTRLRRFPCFKLIKLRDSNCVLREHFVLSSRSLRWKTTTAIRVEHFVHESKLSSAPSIAGCVFYASKNHRCLCGTFCSPSVKSVSTVELIMQLKTTVVSVEHFVHHH